MHPGKPKHDKSQRPRRVAVAALVVLALASVFAISSSPLSGAKPRVGIGKGKLAKPGKRSLYWGAWIGKGLTGEAAPYDMSAVTAFQQMVGKPLSLIEWAMPFTDCSQTPCRDFNFPVSLMNDVRGYGAIPFLSWSSAAIGQPGDPTNQPDFQLRDVTAGLHDDYIRSFATQAAAWGQPFFLRFDWEMNGNWMPWGANVNGNRPEDFVPAWRHVHDIFTSVGATNATWVWCPYVDVESEENLAQFYPGAGYVDWSCLDGYNWGPGSPANPIPWRSFGTLYKQTYRRVVTKIAPGKPMILAEIATSDYGGDKPAWIRNMFRNLKRGYMRVRALIWFDVNDREARWELERTPGAPEAFAQGISDPMYLPNQYGSSSARPIPPPGA
ncbi:MAG TPA: glycosyl hydrolase [Solirubrobacterales bacterium]|nr:glycosyl hydrolase [Solirubrobacterales bacterium]